MTDDRIPTELWIQAHLRRCNVDGIAAYVLHRGDGDRGTVLLKLNMLELGWRLLAQTRDLDGSPGWMPALAGAADNDAEASAYIERAVRRDPDLWVIEIENREGRHPFEGKVV